MVAAAVADLLAEQIGPYGRRLRQMFYLVTPYETTYKYESIDDLPIFLDEAIFWFILLIFLECFYCWKKQMKDVYDLNNFLGSLSAGFIQTMVNKLALRTVEYSLYIWIYENWALVNLPKDSPWTWLLAFLAVDFGYYWLHRAAHEVNILWAFHQMHHNSEWYNLSTGLRQAMLQQVFDRFIHLPEALFIPPQMHVAHEALNRIYQFWLHTPVIGRLGPLEWIFNTPSHHRVHHGRNRYCIDKNYTGVLILWDRLFGTFQDEKDEEPVVYGVTTPNFTYDPLETEFGHLRRVIFNKVPSMDGIVNKLKALFYGPGWYPGKRRMGDLADVPEIENPIFRYHSGVANWLSIYVFYHAAVILISYKWYSVNLKVIPWYTNFAYAIAVILSYYSLGNVLEKKRWIYYLEIFRCLIFYFWYVPVSWPIVEVRVVLKTTMVLSIFLWIILLIATRGMDLNVVLNAKNAKMKKT